MATIDPEFSPYLLESFDDPQQWGVRQLFNDWWRYAPEDVKAKYVADFCNLPEHRAFVAEGFYADVPAAIAS